MDSSREGYLMKAFMIMMMSGAVTIERVERGNVEDDDDDDEDHADTIHHHHAEVRDGDDDDDNDSDDNDEDEEVENDELQENEDDIAEAEEESGGIEEGYAGDDAMMSFINKGEKVPPTMDDDDRNESFIDMCFRLAKNDAALVNLDDCSKDNVTHNSWKWKVADVILLGKALVGNTHLKSMSIVMGKCCLCDESNYLRGSHTFHQGVAQSKVQYLKLINVCGKFLTSLLHGLGRSSSLQHLEVGDTLLGDIRPVLNLLFLATLHSPLRLPSTAPQLPPPPPTFPCRLTRLSLRRCRLSNMDMLALSLALADNPCLLSLNVERNLISNVGIAFFCQNWKEHSPLQELDVSWNKMGPDGACELLQATVRHPALRRLLLTGNEQIGHQGLVRIGELLPHIISLQYLQLHKCSNMNFITCCNAESRNAARVLADGLRGNTSLVELHVGANNFGPLGAKQVMQAAAVHPNLEALALAFDGSIGLEGLVHIGEELPNTKLQRLCLDAVQYPWPTTKLGRKAGQALLRGVQQTDHLTDFSCWGLDSKWSKPIDFYVHLNKTCRPLLTSATITPAVWPYVMARFLHQHDQQQQQQHDQKQQHGKGNSNSSSSGSSSSKMSHLYFALREQPWLVACPNNNNDDDAQEVVDER